MGVPTKARRSLALAVPILAEAAALARSVAFAWAIGPDELGRAMMLALTVRLVEMASDCGLERMLVQAPDGDCPQLQASLQGIAMFRGVIAALVILGVAPVLAALLPDGPAPGAYAALALIPMIRGFAHLDFRRLEREFRYTPMATVEAGATLAMVLTVVPACMLLGDHRAMSAVLVTHAVVFALLSHIVSERRYTLRLSRPAITRSWRFGSPLMVNAVLLFITFYADRMVVAHAYDWADLALYGVAMQLALLPAQIVGRAAASLVLPILARAVSRRDLPQVWDRVLGFHLVMSIGMVAAFFLAAPSLIALVYGDAFRTDPLLAFALALAAGFRILRTPYSQLAIATGRTGDPARANIIRALALLPTIAFAAASFPLAAIAAAAALGEAGATLRAQYLAGHCLELTQQNEVAA